MTYKVWIAFKYISSSMHFQLLVWSSCKWRGNIPSISWKECDTQTFGFLFSRRKIPELVSQLFMWQSRSHIPSEIQSPEQYRIAASRDSAFYENHHPPAAYTCYAHNTSDQKNLLTKVGLGQQCSSFSSYFLLFEREHKTFERSRLTCQERVWEMRASVRDGCFLLQITPRFALFTSHVPAATRPMKQAAPRAQITPGFGSVIWPWPSAARNEFLSNQLSISPQSLI